MADPRTLRIRIMFGPEVAIGPGKAALLGAISETGSISAAARTMAMSYRRAWVLVDTMNRCFREPVVAAATGGRGGGGARLTPLGEEVLSRYREMEKRAMACVRTEVETFAELLADVPAADDSAIAETVDDD